MSERANRWYNHLEILAHHASGSWKPDDPLVAQEFLDSVVTLWAFRLYDLLSDLTSEQSMRVCVTWLTRPQPSSFRDVLRLSDKAREVLISRPASLRSFKQSCGGSQDVGAFIAPVKKDIERWIYEKDPHAFFRAYSFFVFPLRGNFPSAELEDESLASYLSCEEQMWQGTSAPELNMLMRRWCEGFSVTSAPKHGSGSTADAGRTLERKYFSLGSDQRLRYVASREGFDDLYGPNVLARCSRTIFVPKSYKAFRTISMEPAALMWWQQAVLKDLNRLLRRRLSQHYDPTDQSRNREWAWIGSMDGSYATIDLSSASDTVSWDLVKQVFRGTPVLPWLYATRSDDSILPSGDRITLRKFAPMGSALCFPIEVLIFSAIVETTLKEHGSHADYLVYGDDIIVPVEMAGYVMDELERYGFRVNKSKSFTDPCSEYYFRESCGGEYLDGVDVTPLRLPRNFLGWHKGVMDNAFTGLVDLANECYTQSPSIRLWIIKILNRLPRSLRPLFSSEEKGIFSPNPTNWRCNCRWNPDYQIEEYQHGTASIRTGKGHEGVRYIEYLRTTSDRPALGDQPLAVKVGHTAPPRLKSRWGSP